MASRYLTHIAPANWWRRCTCGRGPC